MSVKKTFCYSSNNSEEIFEEGPVTFEAKIMLLQKQGDSPKVKKSDALSVK